MHVCARALACHSYHAERDEELSFNGNDVILVTEQRDTGWWAGNLKADTEQKGWFPASFVKLKVGMQWGR